MYIPDNSTLITGIPSIESDRVSRVYSNFYILFGFMGFVIGSFVLFLTINVSKARFATRNNAKVYAIDLPPRYSEVEPPPYSWVLMHRYLEGCPFQMHTTPNLPALMVICSCLALL